MTTKAILSAIRELPLAKRKAISNRLIEELAAEEPIVMTDEIREEIDRRIAVYEKDPSTALTQEQLDERLDAWFANHRRIKAL